MRAAPAPGLAARAILLLLLTVWTLAFLRHGMDAEYLMLRAGADTAA